MQLIKGDCLEQLKTLEDDSIDSIVTDPPYGLSFMGKKWDYDVPSQEIWEEALRVLKPGGYLLSFAATRTYHRMAVRIEDAGFEIRDMISWLYGNGFPKSHNIGKAVDKLQGNEREITGSYKVPNIKGGAYGTMDDKQGGSYKNIEVNDTKVNSEWKGWGTALKPACEPIVVARKPLSERTVALNVLKWGTGGINIDESRVGNEDTRGKTKGRFPANIILDKEAGKMLDEQSGISKSSNNSFNAKDYKEKNTSTPFTRGNFQGRGDKGGASRFFYCARASKSERNMGCDDIEEKQKAGAEFRPNHQEKTKLGENGNPYGGWNKIKSGHPTVKPLKLMTYLIKLVTKKGGIVLDPFMGSGSTGIACKQQGYNFVGIERDEEYFKIAEARIENIKVDNKLL